MLPSYEIIDPSTHVMIDKSSEMSALIQKNKNLKITSYLVIGLSLLTVLALMTYYTSNTKQEEKSNTY
jgi:RsiW-degrading membrane proteinase PrsW (M82 family)